MRLLLTLLALSFAAPASANFCPGVPLQRPIACIQGKPVVVCVCNVDTDGRKVCTWVTACA